MKASTEVRPDAPLIAFFAMSVMRAFLTYSI
jgi:hypothetical protein